MSSEAPTKPRLLLSFSGGRTSAVMTRRAHDELGATHDIATVFSNTGREDPRSLDFVHECDQRFGWGVVWVEAIVDMTQGIGAQHRVVDYQTASRDGRPFEDYIRKYGIPNMVSPKCTGVLKENTIHHFARHGLMWKSKSYDTAIGIRADEAHRVSKSAKENRYIYPLVDAGLTKADVIKEVRSWGFDLMLNEHEGNCMDCWKKSFRKLCTIALENPERFDWTRRMEEKYSTHKVTAANKSPDGKRLFFRGFKTVDDIFAMAHAPGFVPFVDAYAEPHTCGTSCGIGEGTQYTEEET